MSNRGIWIVASVSKSSMRIKLKWWIVVAFPVVLVVGLYLVLLGANYYYAKRAAYVLQRVRALHLDQSAIEELRQIGAERGLRYLPMQPGECDKIACLNIVAVDNRWMWWFLKPRAIERLGDHIGLRKWQAVADIEIQHSQVMGKVYGIAFFTNPMYPDVEAAAWEEHSLQFDAYEYYPLKRHAGYGFRNASNVRSFKAEVSDEASQASRERAFQFNLKCLTSLRAYTEFSHLMPAAWGDYEDDGKWLDTNRPPDVVWRVGTKCPY